MQSVLGEHSFGQGQHSPGCEACQSEDEALGGQEGCEEAELEAAQAPQALGGEDFEEPGYADQDLDALGGIVRDPVRRGG